MGSTAVVEVVGPEHLLGRARRRIAELERRWSRFLPSSDIARANARRGVPVAVHPDTIALVRIAVTAWERTDGACDATAHDAVVAAGYDQSFEHLTRTGSRSALSPPKRFPGCGAIRIDESQGTIVVPSDGGFDPGAIGKGLASDIVAAELRAVGAAAAFVSIGGDMRLDGKPPDHDGWLVEIRDRGSSDQPVGLVSMSCGGIATSSIRHRRWAAGGEQRHHLIDPATGRCADTAAAQVTALAHATWWAEALATQLMLAEPSERTRIVGCDGALVIDRSGEVQVLGRMPDHLR